jgi:hypothetical protein
MTVTASNKYIDVTDHNSDTVTATLTEGIYRTPEELCDEIASKLSLATGETFTCAFASNGADAGKFTITDAAGTWTWLLKTGTHGSDNTDTHAGTLLGYADTADLASAAFYMSSTVQSYAPAFTPSYDTGDMIICKGSELFIGSSTDSICRKASTCSISLENSINDVQAICATGGILEKLISARAVSFEADVLVEKHEVGLFDKFINNTTVKAMLNIGAKDTVGFVTGSSINLMLGNVSITAIPMEGDDVIRYKLSGKAFVTSSLKDIYLNFV